MEEQGATGAKEEPLAEPGALRNEEDSSDGGTCVVQEEEDGEGAPLTTTPGGQRQKVRTGETLAKFLHWACAKDRGLSTYEALFLRGEGSDVEICALGKKWNLHRVFLCKSRYFASMFSGVWRESNMSSIELHMPDENIDAEALHEVLGSLYGKAVNIPPGRVIPILATASMLQVDDVICQCGEIMKEAVSAQTVCRYCYAAENYGLPHIRAACCRWLLDNLIARSTEQLLLGVSLDLMKELISSSELLVLKAEMDVYHTLKRWVFLHMQPRWRCVRRATLADADLWFERQSKESEGVAFLDTDQGRAFRPVFEQLRLAYIVCDLPSAATLKRERLIPASWLASVYKEQWLILNVAQQSWELGPADVCLSGLQASSMRCGIQLEGEQQCSWTWPGFSFTWDLVVCYSNRCITFHRCALNKPGGLGFSFLWQRKVAFRLRMVSLDRDGRAIFRKTTVYQLLTLKQNQELEVLNLQNQDVVFPIYLAFNFLYLPKKSGAAQSEDP
ncbi:germ cell-less protein-like 1 [Ctenodactylus gundi]